MSNELEHIEPDYESVAEAWMVMEMTKALIAHRDQCISIAREYAVRMLAERDVIEPFELKETDVLFELVRKGAKSTYIKLTHMPTGETVSLTQGGSEIKLKDDALRQLTEKVRARG